MWLYFIKRLALAVVVVALVIAALFVMTYAIPGDPARVALGPRASPELVAEFRARMGLEQPLLVQMGNFTALCCRAIWAATRLAVSRCCAFCCRNCLIRSI